MLSDEMVEKYRSLYQKRYGEEIPKKEARKEGIALLRLMKVIYRPITKPNQE